MKRSLPSRPNLEFLKKEAKQLLEAFQRNETPAVTAIAAYFPSQTDVGLAEVQLALAREYGFSGWPNLKRHVEGEREVTPAKFIETVLEGDIPRAKADWNNHREFLRQDVAAAAAAGDAEAILAHLATDATVLHREVGPKSRPLITYVTFSRLATDAEFEPKLAETLDILLAQGADPNDAFMGEWDGQPFRETPLYGAAGVVNSAILTKRLLEAGADPDDDAVKDGTYSGEALYHACDHPGKNECLRLLLEGGASQIAKDYCIKHKLDFEDFEGVKLFLDHGANPSVPNPATALSHAVLRGRSLAMLQLLFDYGADANVADKDGTTPYAVARRLGRRDVADFLVSKGAEPTLPAHDELLGAAAEGDRARVHEIAAAHPEMLAQFRAMVEAEVPMPAAHELAKHGHAVGLEALIDLVLPVDAKTRYGETLLHWAAVAGQVNTVKMLIAKGANLEARERQHDANPLGWAIWGSQFWVEPRGDYPATVAALLEAGSAMLASFRGSPEVEAVLTEHGK